MPYTAAICTLGCKVSQYESIAIAERFRALGFSVLPFEENADVYVINTCTVTAESDRKSRQMIRRATSHGALVFVCGCYPQVSPEDVAAISGVSYVSGNDRKNDIPDIALSMLKKKELAAVFPDLSGARNPAPTVDIGKIDTAPFERTCIHSAPRTRVYVKIEDGCESHCTYCIIPDARGSIRSKPVDDVLTEVSGLAASGVREVVLTGIETASYGRDLGDVALIDLIEKIAKIDGIERIRLGSLDPSSISRDFVARAAKIEKLAPHFHLSVQSGSSRVLARMKRKYNAAQALEKIAMLRAAIPNVTFTTDMMVGFPGESEEMFEETVAFAREACFLFMHIFPYSRRKGTPADTYPDQIPEEVKHRRVSDLSRVRDELTEDVIASLLPVGSEADVLFESCDGKTASAHTANFIEVEVGTEKDLHGLPGRVRILSHGDGKCRAELISEGK